MNSGMYGPGQQYNQGRLPENVRVKQQMRGPTPLPSAENATNERMKQLGIWNDAKKSVDGGALDHSRHGDAPLNKKLDEYHPEQHLDGGTSFSVQNNAQKSPGIFDDFNSSDEEDEKPSSPVASPKATTPEPPAPAAPAKVPVPETLKTNPPAAPPATESSGGCCTIQ